MSNSTYSSSDNECDRPCPPANDQFLPYDEEIEPIANEEEAAEYVRQVAIEESEEQLLLSRLSGEVDVSDWRNCSNCSLELVIRYEECRCCMEVGKCREKMEEISNKDGCITDHEAFHNVCLDTWVLEVAGIGFKTRAKKFYIAKLPGGRRPANYEYYRSVAYRQFVRLVWRYLGFNKRLPLPCCVYPKIRKSFPSENNIYKGYKEESDEEDSAEGSQE